MGGGWEKIKAKVRGTIVFFGSLSITAGIYQSGYLLTEDSPIWIFVLTCGCSALLVAVVLVIIEQMLFGTKEQKAAEIDPAAFALIAQALQEQEQSSAPSLVDVDCPGCGVELELDLSGGTEFEYPNCNTEIEVEV